MSDSNDNRKDKQEPLPEKNVDIEKKEFIEKLKAQLALEDNESIKLYASIIKAQSL